VRPLTVALLTSDRESLRQFESAINTIQGRVSQLNPELTRQEIEQYKSRIDRAHAELAAIDRRVDDIAVAQLAEFEIDGQPMRAQKLADLVVGGRERHGWFDDSISLEPEHAPPLAEEEAGRLREIRRTLGPDLAPASSAVNASLAVAQPGSETRLAFVVAVITSTLVFGDTIRVPPAVRTAVTSAGRSTVPAPITARFANAFARRAMLSSGSGEFSGTSMRRKPASNSASPTATTSPGVTPRRIAMSGQRANAASNSGLLLMRSPSERAPGDQ
jgi:hypothetical protein